ncbi:MAG TPA: SH3 domain-containing protein [Vicinamibacterales bacterium]|nr:SH3 domain-containing protein [Vicinamibacterales bacterium]
MTRSMSVVAVVLFVFPSLAGAQTAEFTIREASASVHRSPSTGSPVIGRAPRGAVLDVTREVGDWVRVAWAGSEDGAGYIHMRFGSLSRKAGASGAAVAPMIAMAPPQAAPLPAGGGEVRSTMPATAAATTYVVRPAHTIGLGGLVAGSGPAFGATARVWSRNRFGVQFELSRSTSTSAGLPDQVTTVEFAPSVTYWLADSVSDYLWIRPYVAGGISMLRSSLGGISPDSASMTESSMAYRTHGGAEVTFSSVPKFAVTVDAGYRTHTTPFVGHELGGFGFTFAAHWYVR